MQTYVRRKNRDKRVIEIGESIPPKSHKQPRSSSKPRTDFSVFLSPPSISNLPDNQQEPDILDLPLAEWIRSKDKRKAVSTKAPTLEVGLIAKLVPIQSRNTSNVDAQRTGTSVLEFVPEKSTSTMSCDVFLTPGSVVWAKKAPQMWWPAEVLIRELREPNSPGIEVTEGLVLVHYFGSEESGLVDPARDLSPFEDCFEERSCNPSEEFQQAVKQAIHNKKRLGLTKQLIASSEGNACYDSGNSTSSSKTGSDYLKKGSSKRQKKPNPKVNFDEVNVPPAAAAKNSRRMRIMRYLGLAPPVGSPFAQSPMQE